MIESIGRRKDSSKSVSLRNIPIKNLLIGALIIFLCWLPVLFIFFPGIYEFDTVEQVFEFFGYPPAVLGDGSAGSQVLWGVSFTDHKPFFTTILFGVLPWLSFNLTGSAVAGTLCNVLLQMIGLSFTFSLASWYAYRLGLRKSYCWVAIAFFALLPAFAFHSVALVNDISFSAAYALWFIVLIEVIATGGKCFEKRSLVAAFIMLGILMALTKKPGMYIVVITLVVFMFIYKDKWKTFLAGALSTVVIMVIVLPFVIFPIFNVQSGGGQEALGTLFQQTARYVTYHSDELSPQEVQTIDQVLGIDTLASRYNPIRTDEVKGYWNKDATSSEIKDYLSVWFSEGLKHPLTYIEATLCVDANFLSPFQAMRIPNSGVSMSKIDNAGTEDATLSLAQPDSLNYIRGEYRHFYNCIAYYSSTDSANPITAFLCSIGLYAFYIPIICCWLIWRNRRDRFILCIPVLLTLAFLFISPVSQTRYMLPLLFTTVSFCSLAVWCVLTAKHKDKKRKPTKETIVS